MDYNIHMNINFRQTGLTLIELIVTLAVVSTLLAVGIPQFTSSTANSRLTTAINKLSGDLAFARTEAIKRGVPITVESDNADWATDGWTVTENESGAVNLRISPALGANAALNTSGVTSVTFNADGRSTSTVTFTLCDNRSGTFGKQVSLITTGQTTLTTQISCNP